MRNDTEVMTIVGHCSGGMTRPLMDLLHELGCETRSSGNAEEAWKQFQSRACSLAVLLREPTNPQATPPVPRAPETARLAAALEHAGEAVVLTDAHGTILYVNRSFERLTGYDRNEVLGQNPRILKSGRHDVEFYREMWGVIERGEVWNREFTNRRKDGEVYDAEQSIAAVRDATGQTLCYIGVQRDISQRKRVAQSLELLNEQLAVARDQALEANRLKSAFLANVSHELRTPLNVIIGYSEMLREDAGERGDTQASIDLQRIESAGETLRQAINEILDISLIEAERVTLQRDTFPIAPVIREVAEEAQAEIEAKRNVLEMHVADDLGTMTSDRGRFRQVLLSLVENAAKFTDGGRIAIRAQRERTPSQDRIVVTVTDSGIGIPREYHPHLFEPFTQADATLTRRHGGTGLGLAISRGLCQVMGGGLAAESEPGKGSTFTLWLPATPPGSVDSGGNASVP